MSDDFFALLDAQVAEAAEQIRAERKLEQGKRTSSNRFASPEIRAAAKAQAKEALIYLEVFNWVSTATVAIFSQQHCTGCGSDHRLFLQYMEQQQHRKNHSLKWVRVSRADSLLPRQVMVQNNQTHICGDCCQEHGFMLEEPIMLSTVTFSPINISPSYKQDDINAQTEED